MIYCSIDLMDGKAVQLVQGKVENKKIERSDVYALATQFSVLGPINVIDLDAAFDHGGNQELILELAKQFVIRVGGGIRTVKKALQYVEGGVEKIIIGSKAMDRVFLDELLAIVQREKIIIALDAFREHVVIKGWQETTQAKPEQLIPQLEAYCSGFLYTQVEREGMMQGPDFERLKRIRQLTSLPLIAAGGISSLEDIALLRQQNISSVLGMALYTGKINFNELTNYRAGFQPA